MTKNSEKSKKPNIQKLEIFIMKIRIDEEDVDSYQILFLWLVVKDFCLFAPVAERVSYFVHLVIIICCFFIDAVVCVL